MVWSRMSNQGLIQGGSGPPLFFLVFFLLPHGCMCQFINCWHCDRDIYPCIHQLLVIGCTLPVTSCEAERSFSSVRLTMNNLRSTMTEERLAALTLLHLHKDVEICPNEVVKIFISQHTRRMFKGSIIFDWVITYHRLLLFVAFK